MMRFEKSSRWLLALIAGMLLCGCGGGGSSGGVSTSNFHVLLTDAPSAELSAFEWTVDSIYLRRADGTESPNLLGSPRSADLLSLRGTREFLDVAPAVGGPWASVRVSYDPNQIVARALDGAVETVTASGNDVIAAFPAVVDIGVGSQASLVLDLRLDDSLERDPGDPNAWLFDPKIEVEHSTNTSEPVDELHGSVLSADAANDRLSVRLVDREGGTPLGDLSMQVDQNAVLYDDDGLLFADRASFFAAAPNSRIEASGALRSDGVFLADRIKIEQDDDFAVKIKGVLTDLDSGAQTLALRIREVRVGRELAIPVLEALGDPAEITISYATAAIVVEGASPRPGSDVDLVSGVELDVKFSIFTAPPFAATRIEIEGEPRFEGTVTGVAGLPNEFIVHLEPHDPAILSGLVDSITTDVVVEVGSDDRVFLDLGHEPSVARDSIVVGIRADVRAEFQGTSSSPILVGSEVRLRPGRGDATLISADRVGDSFEAFLDDVDDPFGSSDPTSPFTGLFSSDAVFGGDVRSADEFFDLVDELSNEDVMELQLFGLLESSGAVRVHELEVRVR